MGKSFFISFVVSSLFFIIVFLAAMFRQYQRIDYPYLAYGLALIAVASIIISFASSKAARGEVYLSATFSAAFSLLTVVCLAIL